MSCETSQRIQNVLADIHSSYSSSIHYLLTQQPPQRHILLNSFANHRMSTIAPLITNNNPDSYRRQAPEAFLSEWMVLLGLENIFDQTGIKLNLAPPDFEIGDCERHGVDLIASEQNINGYNIPIFALNTKLQKLKKGTKSDHYWYDSLLGCPSIELSLGDFNVSTQRHGKVSFIEWMKHAVIPNIVNSGKIPNFEEWQQFLLKRVSDTISHYMVKTDDFLHGGYKPNSYEQHIFPSNINEFDTFYRNISFSYEALKMLCELYKIEMFT